MVLINFIKDNKNIKLLKDIEKIFDGLAIKYKSGNFKKNIVHYLEYKCEPANINIFYGYINNILTDYSNNNIFIYEKNIFDTNWIPQLHNYDFIVVKSEEDKLIERCLSKKTKLVLLDFYNENINMYYKSMLNLCKNISKLNLPEINNQLDLDELPEVSLCMITYNRRKFMKLFNLNYQNMLYPKEKLEIIIVDDGDEEIKDLLPNETNIKYYKLDTRKSIGYKRNYCVKNSTKDIIAFIDDDDYYPQNSLITRVGHLLQSKKQCVFCSIIGCFDINKYSSIINISPINLPLEKKVSEATLTFKKVFWFNGKFDDNVMNNEGEEFIKNRLHLCKEISWEGVIVSLLHTYNTSNKHIEIKEQNGSHFGFTDEEFTLITTI